MKIRPWLWLMLGSLVGSTSAPAESRTDRLRQCGAWVRENRADTVEFRQALLGLFDSFSEVQPRYTTGQPDFVRLELNADGSGLDAVRFRTKPGHTWKMVWCFAVPDPDAPEPAVRGNLSNWYILRRKGGMEGFDTSDRVTGNFTNVPWTNQIVVAQELRNAWLEGGEEYLLWFAFTDERPAACFVQIVLVPWELWRGADSRSLFGFKSAPPPPAPEPTTPAGWLVRAVGGHDTRRMKAALAEGVDWDSAYDESGFSALAIAAMTHDVESITVLLRGGAPVNGRNRDGQTALHAALQGQADAQLEAVVLLLAHGADVNARDEEGWTPVLLAVETETLDALKVLVEAGADLTATDPQGRTPLQLANDHRFTAVADYLKAASGRLRQKTNPH
jgi:hypothetical protein